MPKPLGLLIGLAALVAPGCGEKEKSHYTSISKPPSVRVVHPQKRDIVRVVGQPSFIVSYERTSIYPKMTAYIEQWIVDIGDKVKKNDTLATLFVPELVESYNTKKAIVQLDKERIDLAEKMVDVASANVEAARAELQEAKAILGKYEAEVERWQVQVARLQKEVDRTVVDPQILLESQNQLKSNIASRDAAKATIDTAQADLLSKQATLAKAKVDVAVAQADLAVADSEEKRLKAWVDYLVLFAPFDGVIAARNANTFDFVLPSTGDPNTMKDAPDLSPAGTSAPIYVVDRTDIVRVFVDIPERDANYVHGSDLRLYDSLDKVEDLPSGGRELVLLARVKDQLHIRIFDSRGKKVVDTDETQVSEKSTQIAELKSLLKDSWGEPRISPVEKEQVLTVLTSLFGEDKVPVGSKGEVLVRAYRDDPIPGRVSRTSWALNVKSRTLRAEIDLSNPGSELLPGMYAYAKVIIQRPGALSLPLDALTYSGEDTYCWVYKDGHSERTQVRTGVSDGDYIEVTSFQVPTKSPEDDPWRPADGSEEIILGDLSILTDGGKVDVSPQTGATSVANAPSSVQAGKAR